MYICIGELVQSRSIECPHKECHFASSKAI